MSAPDADGTGGRPHDVQEDSTRPVDRRRATPLISVAVATYNRRSYLADLLDCLRAQTFSDWELVLVDDGSTDGTAEEIGSLETSDLDLRFVRQKNQGLCVARNTGIEHAVGRYVVFLDDDDRPSPDWLRCFADSIASTNPGFVSCGVILFDEDGADYRCLMPQPLGPLFGGVTANYLPGSFCARRDLLLDIGGFLPGLQASHQTELVIRLFPRCLAEGADIVVAPRLLHRMERRRPDKRREQNPQQLLDALGAIYARHGARVRADKATFAAWEAVAGVSAAKLGDLRQARRRLAHSVTARPTNVKNWTRLAISLVAPLSHRVWGRVDTASPS